MTHPPLARVRLPSQSLEAYQGLLDEHLLVEIHRLADAVQPCTS